MSSQPIRLRPVGNLERYSTARHSLGYYRCVGNTTRYKTNHSQEDLQLIIETAVAQVVFRHPSLRCGIVNEDKSDPYFVQLKSIDLSKHIEYHTLDEKPPEDYDHVLLDIVANQHNQLWPNLTNQPGWKVIIIQNGLSSITGTVFDAMFAFHHAPIDGLSGMVFHRSFLEALNAPKNIDLQNHFLILPDSIILPPAVEKVVNFKISWPFLLSRVWKEFGPKWMLPAVSPPWTGPPCSPSSIQNYQTRAKLIVISAEKFSSLLKFCRDKKLTLTGFLHGLIVISLTLHVPSATSFASTTPYSLRHLTGLHPTEEMGNNVSGLSSIHPAETISNIRVCKNPEQLMQQVYIIAKTFSESMKTEISSLPNDNIVGLLPYVSNVHSMFTSRLGKPRSETYEVSNVGSLKNEESPGNWTVQRAFFTQSGIATGSAISFNVASVIGGPLAVSVTWLDGEIGETLANNLAQDVECSLNSVAEGKGLGSFNVSAI